MLSCVAYCGFAMVPSEEPFLPPPVVAVPLEVADLFLHVPEHASGSQASDHFLTALGFCFRFFYHLKCSVRAQKAFFAVLQYSWCG